MDDYNKVKFGALLHDVGKFWQRCNKWYGVNRAQVREPWTHEDLSWKFCREYLPEKISENMKAILSKDHYSHNFLSDIVHISDWIASGEREKSDEKAKSVSNMPLKSIFSSIDLGKGKPTPKYIKPEPLTVNVKNIYYEKTPQENIFREENLVEFLKEAERLKKSFNGDFDNYFMLLDQLIKKYCFYVPSAAYVDVPDVSLYSHSKVACAIAVCLYKYYGEGKLTESKIQEISEALKNKFERLQELIKEKNAGYDNLKKLNQEFIESYYELHKQKFSYIISGDISGIQDFIYTISSKSALKTLKGRSSFLSLLTSAITYHILEQLRLPETNILFSGGGRFFILAPASVNGKELSEELHDIRKKVNSDLLDNLSGVYLAMGEVPLSIFDFDLTSFPSKWEEAAKSPIKKKKEKWKELFEERFEKIFGPYDDGGKENSEISSCTICNKEDKPQNFWVLLEDKQREDLLKNNYDLQEKQMWLKYSSDIPEISNNDRFCKLCKTFVDFTNYLCENSNSINLLNLIRNFKPLSKFNLPSYLDQDFSINDTKHLPFTIMPLGIPIKDEESQILELSEIAKNAENRTGTKKLALLKADIDDLGKIFKEGLGEKATISRISTLSSQISHFFEGHINSLFNKKEDNKSIYSKDIYIIYSGGDDTLIIGAWDKIRDFAKELNNDFSDYVAGNKNLTISGGISIVNPHMPVIQSSELVGDVLEEAKNAGKSRLNLLGENLFWERFDEEDLEKFVERFENYDFSNLNEFSFVYNLNNELKELTSNKGLQKSFLHRLRLSTKGFTKIIKQSLHGKCDVPRVWRFKYFVARNYLDSNKYSESTKNKLRLMLKLIDAAVKYNLKQVKEGGYESITNTNIISVAARLAEFETRNTGEENV